MIINWRAHTAHELGRTQNHVYLLPHRLLRPYIAHYTVWTAYPAPPCGELLNLVPDASGCVVLHLDGDRASGSLWGATTRAVTVHGGAAGAAVRIFIEFLPGGLFQLTGLPQAALTDGIFSLSDIMPELFSELLRLLETSSRVEELACGLDALLLPILLTREPPGCALSAITVLRQTNGLLTMGALSEREGYSARHLSRVLGDYLGMGPKQFSRLLRINRSVRLLSLRLPLTFLAQESGFYDQAHFIRDFREVCGITPGGYRENMSDFYNEPFKL